MTIDYGSLVTKVEWRWPGLDRQAHGHIDVFENFTGRNALQAIGRFHEVVAGNAVMLAAERIGKDEGSVELSCLDKKTRAIDLPIGDGTAHLLRLQASGSGLQVLALGFRRWALGPGFELSLSALVSLSLWALDFGSQHREFVCVNQLRLAG
jgi:hypothetical protein